MIVQKKLNINFIQKSFLVVILLLAGVFSSACAKAEPEGKYVEMSYIHSQGTRVIEQGAYLKGETVEEQLQEVLLLLSTVPSKLEYQVPLSQDIYVLNTSLNNKTLILNLSEGYKNLNSVTEILTRASLVKSLTQIDGIERVGIVIKGEPLIDNLGKKVGNTEMTK